MIPLFVLIASFAAFRVFGQCEGSAREHLTIGGQAVPALGLELIIQLIFLAAIGPAVWPR